ncbi:MAG: hypothetical protein WCK28_16875 [Burkholderiales bacterium]|jgi:hypothetical protein
MTDPRPSRSDMLRRLGLVECGTAVLTAVLLAAGDAGSPVLVALVGGAAAWMALRGRRRIERADPLDADERRELSRLSADSRHVRDLLAAIERAGQEPVRHDLDQCRRLARVESILDGRT